MCRKSFISRAVCALFVLGLFLPSSPIWAATALPDDRSSGIVYSYFGIGDSDRDVPSIGVDDFTRQLQEISDKTYNVLDLKSLITSEQSKSNLPPRSIAITFDGIDPSVISTAAPLLLDKKVPFTVFVSPGQLDDAVKSGSGVTWDDLRTLAKSPLVTIGLTSYSYGHLAALSEDKILSDLNRAKARFREEMKQDALFFAYPYGEHSPSFVSAVSKSGFLAAFGQQSGVVFPSENQFTLPRFTMTDDFGDIDRFRMTSLALPFPVTDRMPSSSYLGTNPPTPGFTTSPDLQSADLKSMTCFASGMGKLTISKLGKDRIEVRFPKAFEDSKGRMNCTLPGPNIEGTDEPRWRWLGFLFSFPETASEDDSPAQP